MAVYYITTSGSNGNSGVNEANAKAIGFLSSLVAGDTAWVKAGNYGEQIIVINNSGTSDSNRIEILGYKNTIGDIQTSSIPDNIIRTVTNGGITAQPKTSNTFDLSYPIDVQTAESPTFIENRAANDVGEGIAFRINSDYVTLKNFQFKYFERSVYLDGNYTILDNITSVECGAHDPSVSNPFLQYAGKGVTIYNDNHKISNIVVSDAGAEGIVWVESLNGESDNCVVVVGKNAHNATDYLYMLTKGVQNSTHRNTTVMNFDWVDRSNHGILCKADPNVQNDSPTNSPVADTTLHCRDNTFDGFTIINHNLELQFPEALENTFKNGLLIAAPDFWTDSGVTSYGRQDWFARMGLLLQNGSNNMFFQNLILVDQGITYNAWDEIIYDGTAQLISAQNNEYDNLLFINTQGSYPVFDIRRFGAENLGGVEGTGNRPQDYNWSADHHTFYNCTFYNYGDILIPRRKSSDFNFINCLFDDIPDETQFITDARTYDFDYTNSNMVNGFNDGGSTTSLQPIYENEGSYDLRQAAGSPLKGISVANTYRAAGGDVGWMQIGSVVLPVVDGLLSRKKSNLITYINS